MELINGDVLLRDFRLEDVPLKVKWINDGDNNQFLHYDIPLSVDETENWFRNKAENRIDCMIEYRGIPVGIIGLLNIDYMNHKAEYYITIGDISYKRKGIATKATELIIKYGFLDLNLKKIYLNVDEDNEIACKLYEKAGFALEGRFEKDMFFKGEWINRRRYAIINKQINDGINILILSSGTRNKIVEYFKKELKGRGNVICTDMSNLAPSIYEADKFYIVPRITEPGYIEIILDICKKEKIKGILSLIDPELSLLAQNKDRFSAIGTTVIGSNYELCERSLDKYKMYNWLKENGYNCAKSYMNKEEFFTDVEAGKAKYPVFVKPARGSASIAISKVYDKETVELLFKNNDGLMIQEFLDGQEIGADVYIDMISGEVISIFTKKKLKMRAGETDKSVSFKDEKLFKLIEEFVREVGYKGQIDVDIFDVNGEYYISEVNPRFGGGYPHAYESGANHMILIVNNLIGNINECVIGKNYKTGLYMMKYNEVFVKKI